MKISTILRETARRYLQNETIDGFSCNEVSYAYAKLTNENNFFDNPARVWYSHWLHTWGTYDEDASIPRELRQLRNIDGLFRGTPAHDEYMGLLLLFAAADAES